jgi:hypothetical protein
MRIAVCLPCFKQGRGELSQADWMIVLRPVLFAVLGLSIISLSLLALLSK